MASSLMTSALTVDESSGTATITFSLLTAATSSASFAYSLNGLMAYESSSSYGDFWGSDGTVTFAAGQNSQSITFSLNNDASVEPTESLYLWLSNASNLTLGNNQVLVSIVDNDRVVADWDGNSNLSGAEKAQLCVRDVVVDEKSRTATFDLVLDKATTGSFSVVYGTSDGTARAGEDFTAKTGSVTFAAGQTVQHVTVSLTDDLASEGAEFFHLALQSTPGGSASNQVIIADAQGTAVIGRNDAGAVSTPIVTCSPIVVSEGEGYGEFSVQLSSPSLSTVAVDYNVGGLTAYESIGSSGDFCGYGGTLQFAAGVTTQTVRFELNAGQNSIEAMESLVLSLSNPSGATLGNTQVLGTIVDDDHGVGDTNGNGTLDSTEQAQLTIRDAVVDEGAGLITFDLVLDRATTEAFTVAYSTATLPGSASAGLDFTHAIGSVGFAAGQTVQHITVGIGNDSTAEGHEFFNLTLGTLGGSGAAQVQVVDAQGQGLIGANDANALSTPTLTCSALLIDESQGYGEFTLQLNAPSNTWGTIAVNYDVSGLRAYESIGDSGDFTGTSGVVSFAPGSTTQTVRFEINPGANVAEDMASLYLSLSNAGYSNTVNFANNRVLATIVDNDTVVGDTNASGFLDANEKANLSVRDVVVDEKAGFATFDLVLDKATTNSFSVAYSTATAPGTATAGVDFTAASGSVGFAAGQTVQHVSVALVDDFTAEGQESFNLSLGALGGHAATQVVVADGQGQALIGVSDSTFNTPQPVVSAGPIVVSEAEGYAEFTVQLNATSASVVSVNYQISGLTAYESIGSSGDFSAVDGTLTFAPGVTTQTIRWELNGSAGVEPIESLYLSLSKANTLDTTLFANNQVLASIVDSDLTVGDTNANGQLDSSEKANLSVRDVIIDEKAGFATFDLVLDKATTSAFSVAYATANVAGGASAGQDYLATQGSVGFAAGQTVQHVRVSLIDDGTLEGNERFNLSLGTLSGSAANQVQKADATGTALIGANDQMTAVLPNLSVQDAVAIEGQGYADVLVQLSAPASGNVSVNYSFSGGTAYESIGSYGDFAAADGTLVFRAGETSKILRFELNDQDSGTEAATETVFVTLSNAVGAGLADANATVLIADDDNLASSQPLAGGLGHDTYTVDGKNDVVLETTYGGVDQVNSLINYTLAANVENMLLQGSQGLAGTGNELANLLTGNGGANTLTGLAGQDTLIGGAGNDKLIGGTDRDVQTGGGGSDIFDFNALSESGLTTATRDVITDFTHGADRIDVSTLDARATTAGNEAFSFIGHAGFSSNATGQLRFDYNATTHVATLYASTDADSAAEFSLQVTLANATALVASDFIL